MAPCGCGDGRVAYRPARAAPRDDGETFVYATHGGGRLYHDETGYLYAEYPPFVSGDDTLEVPF